MLSQVVRDAVPESKGGAGGGLLCQVGVEGVVLVRAPPRLTAHTPPAYLDAVSRVAVVAVTQSRSSGSHHDASPTMLVLASSSEGGGTGGHSINTHTREGRVSSAEG